jgi:hypothetical protein
MCQNQSREVADELDNRSIGYKREQWEIKPELGANEAQRPDVQQGRVRSTVAHEVAEVLNNSVPELHGTRRNVAEVPNNSVNEPHNTQRNVVEVPSDPVYELYNTRT